MTLSRLFLCLGLIIVSELVDAATLTYRALTEKGEPMIARLFQGKPCTNVQVLEYFRENIVDDRRFSAAHLQWGPDPYEACFIELQGKVYIIGSDKVPLKAIPREKFRDESI